MTAHSTHDSSIALPDQGQRMGALQCQLGTQVGAIADVKPAHAKVAHAPTFPAWWVVG